METSSRRAISNFLTWVDLEKAPPGPPPRPGLEWRDRTSRWIRSDTGTAVVEDSPSSTETDEAGIHVHTPIDMDPSRALELRSQIQEFQPVFESVMTSFQELFSEGEVSGRIKTLESADEKLNRKGLSHISELTDIVGTRIEFPDNQDVYEAVREIEQRFDVIDKEDHSRKDGYYTATHLIIQVDDKPVEVQLRTHFHGRIANYAHDAVYKQASSFSADPALVDHCELYLTEWSSFIFGETDLPPDCPPPIRIVIGCLEDMPSSGQQEQGQEIEEMIEKDVVKDFKTKVFELIHKITAPKGKYRLVEVDDFSDPFETGNVLNDFVFLDKAQQEKASVIEQNPTVKYFIYDEDSKIVG